MDHRAISQVVLLTFILLLLVSCSSRQVTENDPIAGDLTNHESQTGMSAGHNLMGYWNLAVDLDSGEIEIIPARIVSDHLNIVRLLENMTCFQVISLKNLGDNTWQITIRITHPFPMLEYTVFDVRGIMMFDGSRTFPEFGLVMPDRLLGDGELTNADGYTTLYNGSTVGEGPGGLQGYIKGNMATTEIPDATLNGYKRHWSGYMGNTRNALLVSTFVDAQYKLAFPSPPDEFVIGYAVDASWAPADKLPVEDPMLDFPAEANCSEAWKLEMSYEPIGGGITDEGGQGKLTIDIYDHQGPDTIGAVQVECAELIDGVFGGTWVADFPDYSTYEVILENGNLAEQGEYTALIVVEDTDNDPGKPWLDLTAYQVFTVEVGEFIPQAQPPVAIAAADPLIAYVNEPIHFYDDGSFDPDGTIEHYEWDWDNNGVFDEESSDTWHFWTFPGTFEIQFRVTDNDDSTDVLDQPIEITIIEDVNLPPVAIADLDPNPQIVCEPIHFFDNGSYDDDGGIVFYHWDWDNDGIYDEESSDTWHFWNHTGTFQVQFRVTDDGGLTDELDIPLEVIIENALPSANASADNYNPIVGETVNFDGSASFDNDCDQMEIVLYEWDFNNDGVYEFSSDDPSAQSAFYSEQTYFVQLKVTDDEDGTDTLDSPLEIIVGEGIDCLDLKEISKGSYGSAYGQSMEVIKDQNMWESWWPVATGGTSDPPSIDWETEMVIAVTMGEFSTSGYYPTIDWACMDDAEELEIRIGWHHPGPFCMVLMVFTQPWMAVKTDRLDVANYFTDYIDIYECD